MKPPDTPIHRSPSLACDEVHVAADDGAWFDTSRLVTETVLAPSGDIQVAGLEPTDVRSKPTAPAVSEIVPAKSGVIDRPDVGCHGVAPVSLTASDQSLRSVSVPAMPISAEPEPSVISAVPLTVTPVPVASVIDAPAGIVTTVRERGGCGEGAGQARGQRAAGVAEAERQRRG